MPSSLHELIPALIRRNPALLRERAAEAPGPVRPADAAAQPVDPQQVSLAPIERRADLVLALPGLRVVVEAQLRVDNDKLAVWPVHQAPLRARAGHPVAVVVITTKASVQTRAWRASSWAGADLAADRGRSVRLSTGPDAGRGDAEPRARGPDGARSARGVV